MKRPKMQCVRCEDTDNQHNKVSVEVIGRRQGGIWHFFCRECMPGIDTQEEPYFMTLREFSRLQDMPIDTPMQAWKQEIW